MSLPCKHRNLGSPGYGAERHHLQGEHGIGSCPQLFLPILNRHPVLTSKQTSKPCVQRSLEGWLNHFFQPFGTAGSQGGRTVACSGALIQAPPHHIRGAPHIPGKPAGKRHLQPNQAQRLKQALTAQPFHQHLRSARGEPSERCFHFSNTLAPELLNPVIAQSRKRANSLRAYKKRCLGCHPAQPVAEPSPPGSPVRRLGHGLLDGPDLTDHLRLLIGSPVGSPAREIQIRGSIHGGIHAGGQPSGPSRTLAQVPGKIPGTLHHARKRAGKRGQHRRAAIAFPVYPGQEGTNDEIKNVLIVSLQLRQFFSELIGSIIENHLVCLLLSFFVGQPVWMNIGVATAPRSPALRFHLFHLLVGNHQLNSVLCRPLAGILHILSELGAIPTVGKEEYLGGSIQLRRFVQHLDHGIPLPQLLCYHGKLLFYGMGGTNGVGFFIHCCLVRRLEMPPNCSIRNNVLIPKPIPGFILSEPSFGIIIPQNHCQPGS